MLTASSPILSRSVTSLNAVAGASNRAPPVGAGQDAEDELIASHLVAVDVAVELPPGRELVRPLMKALSASCTLRAARTIAKGGRAASRSSASKSRLVCEAGIG
jgi:hypothetical protein